MNGNEGRLWCRNRLATYENHWKSIMRLENSRQDLWLQALPVIHRSYCSYGLEDELQAVLEFTIVVVNDACRLQV